MAMKNNVKNSKEGESFIPEPDTDWREIARWPEFILYVSPTGLKHVAVARSILERESVVYFSNNHSDATTTPQQRALLADALLDWGRLENPTDAEAAAIFRTLHQIIGPKIRAAGWDKDDKVADEVANIFNNALRNISKETVSRGARIIFEAIDICRTKEDRPRKSDIIRALESNDRRTLEAKEVVRAEDAGEIPRPIKEDAGRWYTGKNARANWNVLFGRVGLGDLPD